jgi:hypothetical protein
MNSFICESFSPCCVDLDVKLAAINAIISPVAVYLEGQHRAQPKLFGDSPTRSDYVIDQTESTVCETSVIILFELCFC